MEAIRKLVKVKDNIIHIELPANYNNKTVELIILRADEKSSTVVNEEAVDYEKLYGSLSSGLTVEQIDEQLQALRKEWQRDIS
jgi:hypothetical protein